MFKWGISNVHDNTVGDQRGDQHPLKGISNVHDNSAWIRRMNRAAMHVAME